MTRKSGTVQKVIRHKFQEPSEVNGLRFQAIRSSIRWRAKVRLNVTGETDDSYLSEIEWPTKSGKRYYVDAATGLLFDKQTGLCKQASTVELDIGSLTRIEGFGRKQFAAWVKSRRNGEWQITISAKSPRRISGEDADDDSSEPDNDERTVCNDYAALVD